MSGSLTPPSSSSPPNAPAEGTATPDTKTTSSSPTPATAAPSSGSNTPPRPQIPPGHSGTIRTPHAHDVLSGRGGRINSHPGHVRFREKVDAYKREYLDPRTKKVEKARIAARIVGTIRCLDPSGRFLKEDPHTGLWMEIGDERAWKKAGQALRESAPEIRAERQAQLQMLVASVSVSGVANAGSAEQILAAEYAAQAATSTATGGAAKSSSGGRKSRAADPPGPRHRPKPPEREGLSSGSSSVPPPSRSSSRGGEKAVANNKQSSHNNHARGGFNEADEDAELARMRDEYMQMQRMQAEQQRRMQHYQQQMQHQQAQEQQQQGGSGSGGVMGNNDNDGYGRDVYDEYNQMQQNLMGGYNGNGRSQQQQMAAGSRGGGGASYGQQNSNHQDIAAAIMESDLLPVDAGFDIPALRGDQQQQHQQYAAQYNQNLCQATTNQQPQHTQPYYQEDEHDFNNSHSAFDSRHGRQYFPPNNNSSCDKTVSTMSSFDVQSMDMSHTSLGGFSWNNLNASNNMSGMMNNSAYNMSGLISTGSVNNSSGRYGAGNNYHQHGGGGQHRGGGGGGRENKKGKSKSSGKSALERKLEKVNEAHRREIVAMQRQQQMPLQQQQQAHLQSGMHVSVPTQRDQGGQQQQRPRKFSQEHHNHNMSSFNNSFGFEAIEEDDITEASYKMSNLGLSEMDMTFSSDVLSIRSKSVPKMRSSLPEEEEGGGGGDNKKKSSGTLNRRASTEDGNHHHHPNNKRSNSDVDGNNVDANSSAPKNNNVTAVLPAVGPNIFNQSNSSNSAANSSMSKSANKSLNASNFSMDDFNESFKSMEMEDRGGGNGTNGMPPPQQRQMQQRERLPDPDGAVGGTASLAQQRGGGGGGHQHHHHGSTSHSRRNKDPNGGRLPAISSSRASHHDASSGDRHHNPGPSSSNRRESSESMGLSDPDMLTTSTHDFGVSLESLRSFQSQGSDASGWLNQYNSMENIRSDQNPWDDEDQGSEISAPRMVTATGGGGD